MKTHHSNDPQPAASLRVGGVDRQSQAPAYQQICNLLKQEIASGAYLPGSRLPPESELCRRHQVSPMTVRRSIKALIDQGIVTTIQGSGTFVTPPDLGRATFSLEEFHDIFRDRQATKIQLLAARTQKADEEAASRLNIKVGQRIILLRRLIVRGGDPIVYHRELLVYDPTRPIVEAEMETTTLYGLFVGHHPSFFKRGDLSIEAVTLNAKEAGLLNAMPLQPAFRLEHLFFDYDDKAISWGQFICRADTLRFKTTVGVGGLAGKAEPQ